MEEEGIHAFDSVFMTVKARDREVIIDENGLINYTKLMESITGVKQAFKGICRMNKSLYAHVLHHDRAKLEAWAENELRLDSVADGCCEHSQASAPERSELKKMKKYKVGLNIPTKEIDKFLSSIKTIEIDCLIDAGILVSRIGKPNKLAGTYGPRYLLDFLLFNVDISYYDSIHETIEALDAYSQTMNKSLAQELEELKHLYEFKTNQFEAESKAHEETKAILANIQTQLQTQTQALNEANTKLDEATAQRDDIQAILNQEREANTEFRANMTLAVKNLGDNMSARLDELRDGFNAVVNDETARHNVRPRILCLYKIERLDKRIHHSENEIVLDTFCGLLTSEKSSISKHAIPFNPNIDECIFRQVCGDALDVFDFVSANIPTTIARTTLFKNERKLIVVAAQLEQFKSRLKRACKLGAHQRNAYSNFINNLKEEIRDEVHDIVHDEIAQAVNEIEGHIDNAEANINANIDNAVNEIEEHVDAQAEAVNAHIDEAIAPIIALFYQLHPNATQVYYNHAYRLLIIQNDKIYCHILKSSNQLHELTEEELHKLRFK